MASQAAPTRVRCTIPKCRLYFASDVAMKKHKVIEHEYCIRCDEDFEDDERYLIHRIQSEKHIVCPMCASEFRCEGGRDTHIRNLHRAHQRVTCVGCKQKFNQASALVRHIEEDDCPEIPMTRLLHEQSKKFIIKEALRTGEGTGLPTLPDPEGVDESEGGVKLTGPLEADDGIGLSHPSLINAPKGAFSSAMLAFEDEEKGGACAANPKSHADTAGKGKEKAQAPPAAFPGDENAPFGKQIDAGYTLRLIDRNWDPTRFFSSLSGLYECPCGKNFKDMRVFEHHMLAKSNARPCLPSLVLHKPGYTPTYPLPRCPGCLRMFKSTAALVAHCESGTIRCNLNDGPKFGDIIDEVSGGFVKAVGLHTDGTVKYEAGKIDVNRSTTIGQDMRERRMW
ncbi:hypothetical protein BO70DRAFT_359231 [Aspergillus heteromorphus CBS 117.55]|uniref:C2H2-type domain-containing protein n=1 Tax=Aspergillus heteromorphus CBS 117.55 TaxID=1448321 RepID=A0A317WUP6_9EURO|nr:uncharacterized protein BO70DRAFT_359231 [Aspergillus heteromorphus CBS 117.55]PWY88917.1 hypothetical protein BO70DRAFT_359231 [Aspergillus heteromorphus CBS 117.55]